MNTQGKPHYHYMVARGDKLVLFPNNRFMLGDAP